MAYSGLFIFVDEKLNSARLFIEQLKHEETKPYMNFLMNSIRFKAR